MDLICAILEKLNTHFSSTLRLYYIGQ